MQAVERQRLVSMPTGPSAPAGAISGPTIVLSPAEARYQEGQKNRLRLANSGEWGDPNHDIAWLEVNCPTCVSAVEVTQLVGAVLMATQDLRRLESAVRDVSALEKEANSGRDMMTLFHGHRKPLIGGVFNLDAATANKRTPLQCLVFTLRTTLLALQQHTLDAMGTLQRHNCRKQLQTR